MQVSEARWSAKARGNNIDRLDLGCNIPSGQNIFLDEALPKYPRLRAELHRLSPADAGSGGPPRPGVDPVTLARNTARNSGRGLIVFLHLTKDMPMSLNCRVDYVVAGKDYISEIFRGAASRPCGPPALWLGSRSRPRAAERRRLKRWKS